VKFYIMHLFHCNISDPNLIGFDIARLANTENSHNLPSFVAVHMVGTTKVEFRALPPRMSIMIQSLNTIIFASSGGASEL
jgi:hypothetical protein